MALGATAAIACVALGIIAVVMFKQIGRAVSHTASLSSAIRLQGDADMMHDALYGSVLAGMLAALDGDRGARAGEQGRGFAVVADEVENVTQAADSMREQAAAVQHVSGSAEKISGMAEENAAVSAKAERSARRLSEISETLRVTAATFKVREKLTPCPPQAAPPPRAVQEEKIELF